MDEAEIPKGTVRYDARKAAWYAMLCAMLREE